MTYTSGRPAKRGRRRHHRPRSSEHIHQHFEALINATDEDHIVINGDLFDGFEVPGTDLIRTFNVLDRWFMKASAGPAPHTHRRQP
jgi:metallophosphoesterase superfamily enzyme